MEIQKLFLKKNVIILISLLFVKSSISFYFFASYNIIFGLKYGLNSFHNPLN